MVGVDFKICLPLTPYLLCLVVALVFFLEIGYAEGPRILISTSQFPHESIKDLKWLDTAVVFITDTGRLRRSTDQGRTWSAVSMDMGKVDEILTSPVDADCALVMSSSHVCTTDDAGETWTMVDFLQHLPAHTLPMIEAVKMHPRFPNWILFLVRDDPACEKRQSDADNIMSKLRDMTRAQLANANPSLSLESKRPVSKCLKRLYVTKDLGETLEMTPVKVFNADWSHSHLSRLYALVGSSSFTTFANADLMDVSVSDDFFKTKRTLPVKGVNRLIVESTYTESSAYAVEEFLFLQQPNLLRGLKGSAANILISSDHGSTFSKARIPPGVQSFEVLDTSEGQVFFSLELLERGIEAKLHHHLYVSDALGTNYSLSLMYLADPDREFVKVEGVEGVYIVNVIDATGERQAVMTMITHNKGSTWRRLPIPTSLANHRSVPSECSNDPDCTLHLADLELSLVSSDSASGLILARGNIGRQLNRGSLGNFFSRDSGLTWEQVPGEGAHWFALGDSGGVLVLVESARPTNVLYYSYDQSLTWEQVQFASEEDKISVSSLEVDAVEKGTTFLLRGTNFLGTVGVMISVTLGEDLPLCSTDADYERWLIGEKDRYGGGRSCLMGREVTVTRRKRASRCLNGIHHEQVETTRICECTENDFECDVGYRREVTENNQAEPAACIRDETVDLNFTLNEPAVCHDFYPVSKGYRKIAGDSCKGGLDFSPRLIPCKPKGMRSKGWLLLIVIGLLAFGIIKGGNRAGELLKRSKGFVGLREANFMERLREWLENRLTSLNVFRSFFSSTSKYKILGSGHDVPERPPTATDLFFESEEVGEEEERVKEIEVRELSPSVDVDEGDDGFGKSHFTVRLPRSRKTGRQVQDSSTFSRQVPFRTMTSDLGDDV